MVWRAVMGVRHDALVGSVGLVGVVGSQRQGSGWYGEGGGAASLQVSCKCCGAGLCLVAPSVLVTPEPLPAGVGWLPPPACLQAFFSPDS